MYVEKGANLALIEPGLTQVFEYQSSLNVGQKEIIKMKNSKVITGRDLEITKLLFEFQFATLEQIHQYINLFEEESEKSSLSAIENRLNKLVSYRVLNRFMLTNDSSLDKIQPNALRIYCMDVGGRYLLANYTNLDTIDWYTSRIQVCSEIVTKCLSATNFFLSLANTVGGAVENFRVLPEIRVKKSGLVPTFDFTMDINGIKSHFIGEVVRENDFPIQFRDKIHKIEEFLEGKNWKRYYYDAADAPVLLIVTESDALALKTAQLMTEVSEITRYRLSTDERVQKPLYELGAFLKYIPESDALKQIKAKNFLIEQ